MLLHICFYIVGIYKCAAVACCLQLEQLIFLTTTAFTVKLILNIHYTVASPNIRVFQLYMNTRRGAICTR